jgi:hypothetical protein
VELSVKICGLYGLLRDMNCFLSNHLHKLKGMFVIGRETSDSCTASTPRLNDTKKDHSILLLKLCHINVFTLNIDPETEGLVISLRPHLITG